jgi:hypothetical protein
MKKRDTYRSYLIKRLLGLDNTYYKPNPKFSRAGEAPTHLALVIDGIVEDIIHCDERFGDILLSNPKIIDLGKNFSNVNILDTYDENSNTFYSESKNV